MSEHVVMRLVRSVTVSNPVPFMAVCLLLFAFGCFALVASIPHDLFAVAILVGGFISLVAGVTSALYGLFRHPDLMRSERFHVMNRFLDLHGDDRVPLHHTRLSETMRTYLQEDLPKRAVPNHDNRIAGVDSDDTK